MQDMAGHRILQIKGSPGGESTRSQLPQGEISAHLSDIIYILFISLSLSLSLPEVIVN